MHVSKRRKPKFLRDDRMAAKNSSPSVHRRRERSPPGKAGSHGGGAARPTGSAPSPSAANRSRGLQIGESVGWARGRRGAAADRLASAPHREVSRASPAQPGSHPAHRQAEEPPGQSHVGGRERGGRWAPGTPTGSLTARSARRPGREKGRGALEGVVLRAPPAASDSP